MRRCAVAVVAAFALVSLAASPGAAAASKPSPVPDSAASSAAVHGGAMAAVTPLPSPPSAVASAAGNGGDPAPWPRLKDRGAYGKAMAPVPTQASAVATDHVLVRFAPGTSTQQRGRALHAAGVSSGQGVAGTEYVKVPVNGKDPQALITTSAGQPGVADAQLDHVRHLAGWTSDPAMSSAWPYFDLSRLPRAWDASTGAGAVVAVVDTGVTGTVPDLAGSVLPGIDLVNGFADAVDLNGHGTAMAGIIAAHANNGIGSAGVAYGAKILPVRVLDASGDGADSTIAAGISWAVAHGAHVVNLSLAGPAPAPVILAAIQSATAAGALVVAAAGNDGADVPEYPAAYATQVDGLIAVAATDDTGARPAFSTRGDWVSVAAPGVDIVAPDTGTGYVTATGTSSSAALVSGVAALLASHDPALTPAIIKSRLVLSARDAGPRGADPYYGAGVVDAASAVTYTDPVKAAVAIPLDQYPSDPGPADNTPATARVLSSVNNPDHPSFGGAATGTLSPEGDQDWYRVTLPTWPGMPWWRVYAGISTGVPAQTRPDPVIEIRDSSGRILGKSSRGDGSSAWTPTPSDRVLLVGVTDATGFASTVPYELFFENGYPPIFTSESRAADHGNAIALGDVTGDGVPDALVPVPSLGVEVFAGNRRGTFDDAVKVASTTAAVTGDGVAVFDADGDGRNDAAVTTTNGIQILLQRNGELVDGGSIILPGMGETLASGDIDGDGDLDLVTATTYGSLVVLKNDGHAHFSVASTISPVPALFNGQSTPIRLGDVSGDGRVDIVGSTGLSTQQPDGTFGPWTAYTFPNADQANSVGVADVTGDGRSDVVVTTTSDMYVLAQTTAGGLAAPVAYPGWSGTLNLADFDGDGRADVLSVSDQGAFDAALLFQQANGTLGGGGSIWLVGGATRHPNDSLQSADLDGDGCQDAVLLDGSTLTVLHRVCASPTPGQGWVSDVSPSPQSAGVGVRPTVRVAFVRDLDPASVGPATVRLREGQAGTPVSATVSYDPASRVVSLVPTLDLIPGHHYELVADGVQDIGGNLIDTPVRTWFTVGAGADRFTPVDPVRVLDTREVGQILPSGQVGELSLAGVVPPEATSVVLNVTSTQATSVGNVRVFPAGLAAVPTISNLNVVTNVDQANLVTVALGTNQAIDLMTDGASSHLIVDLAGYYSPDAAAGYVPMSPVRVMDTRDGTGSVPTRPLSGGQTVDLTVSGRHGVPADALAVVMNVTGTDVTGITHLRVYPTPGSGEDQTPPTVSSVNLRAGRDQPNLVTVRVGDGGKVRFYTPTQSTDVVADLVGYYSGNGDNGFVPLSPARAVDTRIGQGISGSLHRGTISNVVLAGVGHVPAEATAVVLNVVGVQPNGLTHVRVFPTTNSNTLPNVSTLNLVAGRDEANLTIQAPGIGGQISFYPHSADMNLVVDISGYFRH